MGEISVFYHRAHYPPDLRSAGPFVVSYNRTFIPGFTSETRGLETMSGARGYQAFVRCPQQQQRRAQTRWSVHAALIYLFFLRRARGY